MNLHILFITALALSLTACGSKEEAAPAEESMATDDMMVETPAVETPSYDYEGILRHMHTHADQIDILNNALADGDLEAGKIPARWLWRHETMTGVPDDWQPYMAGMRQAARDIGSATDLETARAAAARVSEQCQACHTAVGISGHTVKPM